MALSKSTPDPKNRPTMLSRRIANGNPVFSSIPALWSTSQDSSPCIAFDVTWDGDVDASNPFQGYSIRVAMSASVESGDLVLAVMPMSAGGVLRLATIDAKGKLLDASASTRTRLKGANVLGKVIEEREYALPDNPKESLYPLPGSQVEGLTRLIDCGIATVRAEEEDDWALNDILETSVAMADSAGYLSIRDRFRSHDPKEPKWIAGKSNAGDPGYLEDPCHFDYPLRFMLAMVFRVGQFIGGGSPTSRLVTAR